MNGKLQQPDAHSTALPQTVPFGDFVTQWRSLHHWLELQFPLVTHCRQVPDTQWPLVHHASPSQPPTWLP